MSERGRNLVQLATAPQFLVDSLDANSHEPLVAIAALSALASYVFVIQMAFRRACSEHVLMICNLARETPSQPCHAPPSGVADIHPGVDYCGGFHVYAAVVCWLIGNAVRAACRYCELITCGNLDPVPVLPHVCYSAQTLSIAADLTVARPESSPLLEALEGLPCRSGLLDAPFQFLFSLLPSPQVEGNPAVPSLPNASVTMNSPLVSAFLSVLSGPHTGLQDLSPDGAIRIPRILGRMVSTSAGAVVLSDKACVSPLVGLLSPQHISALLVWPINSGGNRRGVTDMVNAVCNTLNHTFAVSETSGRDSARRAAENKLMVCPRVDVLL